MLTCSLLPVVVFFVSNCLLTTVVGLNNGLVQTPPMGWLSWARFTCQVDCQTYPDRCINEQLYKQMADRLVADGFKDVGYEFVNIDDCWSEMDRDPATKRLVANKKRFPSGIKALADYVHSKGLKLGIYGDVGTKTCAGYPGQFGNGTDNFFAIDAQTFADWGVDSFKFDGCNLDPRLFDKYFPMMQKALNDTGAPIVFSCAWGDYQYRANVTTNLAAMANTCNIFFTYNDMKDSWEEVAKTIDFYAQHQDEYVKYNGPGQWFDPDELMIGGFGLSWDQSRAMLAMWAMWSSPLYMSNDLRTLRDEHRRLLQTKKVIAVNQDPMGVMGQRVYQNGTFEAWSKKVLPQITCGQYSYAVLFLNRKNIGDSEFYSVPLTTLIPNVNQNTTYLVYDLFEDEGDILGKLTGGQSLRLSVNPAGGVRMVKLVILD